jgi:hypothetical protein
MIFVLYCRDRFFFAWLVKVFQKRLTLNIECKIIMDRGSNFKQSITIGRWSVGCHLTNNMYIEYIHHSSTIGASYLRLKTHSKYCQTKLKQFMTKRT